MNPHLTCIDYAFYLKQCSCIMARLPWILIFYHQIFGFFHLYLSELPPTFQGNIRQRLSWKYYHLRQEKQHPSDRDRRAMPSPEGIDRHRAVIPPIRPMPARNSLNNYIISHKFCCIDKPTQKNREKLTSEAPDFFFFI